MKQFLEKVGVRAMIFALLLATVFFIKWPRSYYFNVAASTDYDKLAWNENKLNSISNLDSTIVFVGSSICYNDINDSLMNEWDGTQTQYLNLGVSHSCNAIVNVILKDMLENRKLRPAKVMLCLKSDAMASGLHKVYPLVASSADILESATDGNMWCVATALKKVSWNTHFFTNHFKLKVLDSSRIQNSFYGFHKQNVRDSMAVESVYAKLKNPTMLNMNSIEQDLQAKPKSFKLKLVLAKLDYIDNIKYQRNSFIKSMEILDQYGIDYDIILYPNLIHTREDKQLVMKEYYTKIFPEIDYNKHSLIVMQDSTFTNANLWFDMNHLSYDGASRFSQFIFEELR